MAAKFSRTLLRSMLGDNSGSRLAKSQAGQGYVDTVESFSPGPGGYIDPGEPISRSDGGSRVLQRNNSVNDMSRYRDEGCKSDQPARPRMRRSNSEPALAQKADAAQSRPAASAAEESPATPLHELLKALEQACEQAEMAENQVVVETTQRWIDKLKEEKSFVLSLQVERAHDRRAQKSLQRTHAHGLNSCLENVDRS
jgi:hypothetical protein